MQKKSGAICWPRPSWTALSWTYWLSGKLVRHGYRNTRDRRGDVSAVGCRIPISRDVPERAFAHELEVGSIEMDIAAMKSMAMQIKKGNTTMLIWYSKNRWGWRDNCDTMLPDCGGGGDTPHRGVPAGR